MIETTLSGTYTTGETYEVPCAELIFPPDRRVYYIPIIDHLHADVQFGFPDKHYHIDGRFEIDPRMRQHFRIVEGFTNCVIVPDEKNNYTFKKITTRIVKCICPTTGLSFPEHPNEKQQAKLGLYQVWYQSYLGKICEGKRCPHFGSEMIEINGRLVCPLHNLTADLETLKIIEI
ncbi:hypothetical protein IDJ75_11135 [Mucilaginibacter rigui]|uniref:Rieske domain-containing protein n=1 Tax=Mucilaginibacter rigui TaxID=534635 RepID=A0ABR7X5H4_9SPHI|nr:hypothetical protein [Mucilaginibacter rigui]MBD1385834.1 hypothetical protein [Mucilaginibacter rigui]